MGGPDERGPRARDRMWRPRLLARYWLLQLPGTLMLVLILFVLDRMFSIPLWFSAAVVAVWVVKDALLYPLLWRSYDAGAASAHTMIGLRGVAAERIDPAGYAYVRGERWRVELASGVPPIERGAPLCVEATRGLTLIVRSP